MLNIHVLPQRLEKALFDEKASVPPLQFDDGLDLLWAEFGHSLVNFFVVWGIWNGG